MPIPIVLPFIAQGAGAAMNIIAMQKLKKQAQDAYNDLKGANQNALDQFDDLFASINEQDTLSVDRSLMAAYEEAARSEAIAMNGRAFGDEMARDSVRQASANALSTGLNMSGTGADSLAILSDTYQSELNALNQVDMQSAQARYGAIAEAKQRLLNATRENAMFNHRADLMEYNDRLRKQQQLASLKMDRLGMERDFSMSEISQEGAIAQAKAAMWNSLGNTASSIGGTMFDIYSSSEQNELLKSIYGTDIPGPATSKTSSKTNDYPIDTPFDLPINMTSAVGFNPYEFGFNIPDNPYGGTTYNTTQTSTQGGYAQATLGDYFSQFLSEDLYNAMLNSIRN